MSNTSINNLEMGSHRCSAFALDSIRGHPFLHADLPFYMQLLYRNHQRSEEGLVLGPCQMLGLIGIICDIDSVETEVKAPPGRKVAQVSPQRHDTIRTDAIPAEAKLLDRNEVCQMGRQRFNTIVTDAIHAEVKMLDAKEVC